MTNEEALKNLKEFMRSYDLFIEDVKSIAVAIQAVNKQIQRKPKNVRKDSYGITVSFKCPCCGSEYKAKSPYDDIEHGACDCGQRLLWEDEE